MTKEFDRLREVAQVDNFLAGSSQSGVQQTSPVTIAPNGQAPQRPAPATAMPKTGTTAAKTGAGVAPGSAALPRPQVHRRGSFGQLIC